MVAKKYELMLFKIHLQPPMRKTPMHLSSHRQRVWKKIVRLHELVHGGNQTIPTMAQMEAIVAIVEFNLEKCPNWKIVGAVIFPLKPINAAHQIPNRIISTHVHTHSHNYIVPAEPQVTWSLKRLSPFYVFCGGDVERASWRPALRYKKKNRIIHTFGVNEIEWKVQLVFIEQQVMPYQMKFNEIEH